VASGASLVPPDFDEGVMSHTFSDADGYSLIDMLAAIALIAVLAAVAVPTGLSHVEDHRLDGAARYIAALCATARSQAVRESAYVAIRFEPDAASGDFAFRLYVDGNRNGVRTAEITSGVDRPRTSRDHLGDRFRGVRFGVAGGVTGIDPGDVLNEGDNPIRVGSANLVSFSPNGSVTSGTLYIRSDRAQRAVRLLGVTGRSRLLEFSYPEHRWIDR
jgi:type II secretory pathway pseudopilin PulG